MIAKDYNEVLVCVSQMISVCERLKVPELTTRGHLTFPAQAFAKDVALARSRGLVEQWLQERPEQAQSFLTILCDIRAELLPVCVLTGTETGEDSRVHAVAAEAVAYAIKARRSRSQGYSGAYLSFPKD